MSFAEFLIANQNWVAPIIEWGGMLLFLAIILSPFLIIRNKLFRPTRWWHIVGAYIGSFLIFLVTEYFLGIVDQWVLHNLFTTWDLWGAYNDGGVKGILWLVIIYPTLAFYSAKLLYGSFTEKRFWLTTASAVLLFITIVLMGGYVMIALVGQALTTYL